MFQKRVCFILGLVTVLFLLLFFNSGSSAQITGGLPPFKIIQLGDSYSAGNGARSLSGEQNYYSVSGCYRSPTNWGYQFAASLQDTFAITYINRACSGGVNADITNERNMHDVRLKNLDGSCPTPEYPDEEEWRETSLISCTRYIKPQLNAIDTSVDLVLMTMGGNDLGFATIVQDCFSVLRTPTTCRIAVDNAKDGMELLKRELKEKFLAIKSKLRDGAKIAYVSYPNLLINVPYKLELWNGPVLLDSYEAGNEILALSITGEEFQRAAVVEANAIAGINFIEFYDGTKALFSGHEPDPSLLLQNPDRWIAEFEGITPAEWYHPNSLGHENWANALSPFENFGVISESFSTNADIDVAFVVDTTGSMGDDIAQVRTNLSSLVAELAAKTDSYRVAVVSYRDFPSRTGWSGDYPFRVDQPFTTDPVLIQAAIDSLIAAGGGDYPETVFSGIQAAIDLTWRPGVTKLAIVIGDAPALSPEPITNLTAAQIIANSIAVDPIQVIGVDTGGLNANGAVGQIANGTGGSIVQGTSGLTAAISEILDQAVKKPFAWFGQAYSGKIGQPILFDASGSYDPASLPITLFEWDFNGDGVFDYQTQSALATHTYDVLFNGFVILRVTGQGGTALASARTVVNAEGFASQGDEKSCELDINGYSIIVDDEGRFIPCKADNLPESGLEGVREISGNSPPTIPVLANQLVQYSDMITFTISASDPDNPVNTLTFSASGLPNDIVLTNNGDGTATISGVAKVAPGTYNFEITVSDPGGLSDTKPVNIVVTQEDARTTYTGPMMFSTACADCSTASIFLRATIQDISAVVNDPKYDEYPGDITKAKVDFVDREKNTILCSAPVTLLDDLNTTSGTAWCEWMADIGSNDGYNFNVGLVVSGNYTRNSTADDAVVVVSKPSLNSITGGGYLTNQTTAGTYAGDVDLRSHFGFNIKFIKNKGRGQSIIGRASVIIRQGDQVFLVKTNALDSLLVSPATSDSPAKAEFVSKASIVNVTDPGNPILLSTLVTLNFTMTDFDEASGQFRDLVGITMWSKNGKLLFSSNWTGTKTIEQAIDAGNLEIHQFTENIK